LVVKGLSYKRTSLILNTGLSGKCVP